MCSRSFPNIPPDLTPSTTHPPPIHVLSLNIGWVVRHRISICASSIWFAVVAKVSPTVIVVPLSVCLTEWVVGQSSGWTEIIILHYPNIPTHNANVRIAKRFVCSSFRVHSLAHWTPRKYVASSSTLGDINITSWAHHQLQLSLFPEAASQLYYYWRRKPPLLTSLAIIHLKSGLLSARISLSC